MDKEIKFNWVNYGLFTSLNEETTYKHIPGVVRLLLFAPLCCCYASNVIKVIKWKMQISCRRLLLFSYPLICPKKLCQFYLASITTWVQQQFAKLIVFSCCCCRFFLVANVLKPDKKRRLMVAFHFLCECEIDLKISLNIVKSLTSQPTQQLPT